MVIRVFDKKATSFDTGELAELKKCISAKTIEKYNDIYELEITYPLWLPLWLDLDETQHFKMFNIIEADDQLFRIYNTVVDTNRSSITIYARHYTFDTAFYTIPRRVPEIIERTLEDQLEWFNSVTRYEDDREPVTTTMTTNEEIYDYSWIQYSEALNIAVNLYKGEIVRDRKSLVIQDPNEIDSGVIIKYGKNLKGITVTTDIDEVATVVRPYGKNWVANAVNYAKSTNPNWNDPQYPDVKIEKKYDFDIELFKNMGPSWEKLKALAEAKLLEVDKANINYRIDAINIEGLENVGVRDIVTVIDDRINLNIKLKVISKEKDLLKNINTRIELGNPRHTLITSNLKEDKKIKKDVEDLKKYITIDDLEEYLKLIVDENEIIIDEEEIKLIVDENELLLNEEKLEIIIKDNQLILDDEKFKLNYDDKAIVIDEDGFDFNVGGETRLVVLNDLVELSNGITDVSITDGGLLIEGEDSEGPYQCLINRDNCGGEGGSKIFISTDEPDPEQGKDGDLWIVVEG